MKTQERRFETSTGAAHCQKSYTENTVGRKVMKTQDWVNVNLPERDEQLIVEHGTWRRRQKQPDDELYAKIPKGDYSQQQPVTIWTANLDRKNYYQSASVGPNPFARTSGMTQTADQTKAVSGFYGNIDFAQEAYQSQFRKMEGTDLNRRNPFCEKPVEVSNMGVIATRIVDGCKKKSPGNGLRALRVALRRVTVNGMIDPVELKYGLRTFGVELNEEESQSLLRSFDPTRCGKISVNELLHVIRNCSWNSAREGIAIAAYNRLDTRGDQSVTIAELEAAYDFTPNPEYQFGQKSGTELMAEFLAVWETQATDGVICLAEFLDFYKDVSPTIIADNVFENMVKNSWR